MAKLGQIDEAKKVLGEAVKLFHELEMPTEPPRVRGAIADMLVAAGRYNEAIAELYMARQEFLALNLPVIAALVSLDVVDLLLVQQRTSEVEHLCNEMIRVFTAANLSRNALQALAHLQDLAGRSAVTSEDVQHVRVSRTASDCPRNDVPGRVKRSGGRPPLRFFLRLWPRITQLP